MPPKTEKILKFWGTSHFFQKKHSKVEKSLRNQYSLRTSNAKNMLPIMIGILDIQFKQTTDGMHHSKS